MNDNGLHGLELRSRISWDGVQATGSTRSWLHICRNRRS